MSDLTWFAGPRWARQRRGISLIYTALIMVGLIGFIALGVDIGRMQVAKYELRIAADGSARAAAWLIKKDREAGRVRAKAIAEANFCLGEAIDLVPGEDVDFGRWDPVAQVFTPKADTDTTCNAVRVTTRRIGERSNPVNLLFAPVIGIQTANVEARAVAVLTGAGGRAGLIGLQYIKMNGITSTDSYNSSYGQPYPYPYSATSPGQNGDVASNGLIDLVGQSTVNGDAYWFNTQPDVAGKADITGDPEQMLAPLRFPPVNTADYSVNSNASLDTRYFDRTTRNFTLENQQSYTIVGGATDYVKYYLNDVKIGAGAVLTIQGKVELCVTGSLDFAGGVYNANMVPGDFRVRMAGDGPLTISGHSDIYADIYCPQASATFNGLGNPKDPLALFGAIIAESLTINGNSDLHYDEALAGPPLPPRVVLVD